MQLKRKIKLTTLSAFLIGLMPLAAVAADSGSIVIKVSGLNNDKGVVRIALFNDKEKYAKDKGTAAGAFKKDIASIKDKGASYTFSDVPFGEYAIKIYHDEDNSGTFYTGMMGIPKVQYAFSNNAKGMMGPATFDKAKFKLDKDQVEQDIKMLGKGQS